MNEWQRKLLAYLRERRRVMLTVPTEDMVNETQLQGMFENAMAGVPPEYLARFEVYLNTADNRWAEKWVAKVGNLGEELYTIEAEVYES